MVPSVLLIIKGTALIGVINFKTFIWGWVIDLFPMWTWTQTLHTAAPCYKKEIIGLHIFQTCLRVKPVWRTACIHLAINSQYGSLSLSCKGRSFRHSEVQTSMSCKSIKVTTCCLTLLQHTNIYFIMMLKLLFASIHTGGFYPQTCSIRSFKSLLWMCAINHKQW